LKREVGLEPVKIPLGREKSEVLHGIAGILPGSPQICSTQSNSFPFSLQLVEVGCRPFVKVFFFGD